MSKLIAFTAFAVVVAVGIAIASLVLNIIILTKSNTINSNTNAIQTALKPSTPSTPNLSSCQSMGAVSNSEGWQNASNYLVSGLDDTVNPCQDFYAFTCNKYLASINLDALNLPRKGTYDDSQVLVNTFISAQLAGVDYKDTTVSLTERITKHALDSCVYSQNSATQLDYTKAIYDEINGWFGGVPFLGGNLNADVDFFKIAANLERTHALGTLMFSWSSVDYEQVSQNALYVSQPDLDLPHDYFVKPQFIDKLSQEQQVLFGVMKAFAAANKVTVTDAQLEQAAQDVVSFEVLIAMASWPDDLMRNYKLQYNKFNLASLKVAYPNIKWDSYLDSLLSDVQSPAVVANDGVVISQPSYFAWLDSVFQPGATVVTPQTIANYMIVQLLQDDGGFWGGQMKALVRQKNYIPYIHRRGRGVRRIGRRHFRRFDDEPPEIGCIDAIMAYMPYGPGFSYVKGQGAMRDTVAANVTVQTDLIIENFQGMMKTLPWMSNQSLAMAIDKSNKLIKNYGWPTSLFGDFVNTTVIDGYHQDYTDILNYNVSDFYNILKVLKRGMENREAFRLLNLDDNKVWGNLRANFLQSPAEVNAWYQPERNSITFPYAAWNPPYFGFYYPQAYNFAGQGGTGGHELTHGFDDEGVQFGADGSMTNCGYKCGWMDSSSNSGFQSMADCVVSQFSSQCCPLQTGNVHCANGASTQGENIADLGGQQAAYLAYRQYIEQQGQEEPRLPGLSQYTPNQIFWITYGFSWCMKQTDANMVKQLLTNPHAPAECRVNNVMQDIPSFGKDFNCNPGDPMYPLPDQRCKVWVGY